MVPCTPKGAGLLAALLIAAPPVAAPGAAQERDVPRGVTATGTCTAELAPDRASLNVTVTRTGPDVARVAADASSVFNLFRREVEGLNLPGAVLASNGLQVSRNVDYSGQTPVFRGYAASASLRVEASDPARLAAVIPLALKARIDDVGEIALSVSDAAREQAVLDCLPRADARAKAEAMARGLGLPLGPALRIGDYRTGGDRPPPLALPAPMAVARAVPAPVPAPEVSAGVQRLSVSTTVTFGLGEDAGTAPR